MKKVKNRAEEKRAAGEESPLKAQREAAEQRAQMVAEAEAAAAEGQEEEYTIDPEAPLGPGGLHPAEVFKELPEELQQCFISQDVEMIKKVLIGMTKEDASYHFDRCIKSGLWNPGGGGGEAGALSKWGRCTQRLTCLRVRSSWPLWRVCALRSARAPARAAERAP